MEPLPARPGAFERLRSQIDDFRKADVIFAADESTGEMSLVYGADALLDIVHTGSGQALGKKITVDIRFNSEELEMLLATVIAAKGSHCYGQG